MASWHANILHIGISDSKISKAISQKNICAHQPKKSDISDNNDRQHGNRARVCPQHQ